MPTSERIFHITSDVDWAVARRLGVYAADSLASEGFIHCSDPRQVTWVANNRFLGRTDLVLLHIDPARLEAAVCYENFEGGVDLFPHVYGPIELDAIVAVTPFRCESDGRFRGDGVFMSSDIERDLAVRAVVARIANRIDNRQWDGLRALFAGEVTTDYTSLFGGEVQRQRGDDLIAGWRRLLGSLDATQHLVGAIDVQLRGDRAVAECHVRGYHVHHAAPGGAEWMVAGQWVIELQAAGATWLIVSMTLRTFYQTGNRALLSQVAAL